MGIALSAGCIFVGIIIIGMEFNKRNLTLVLGILGMISLSSVQTLNAQASSAQIEATRIQTRIKIDGNLREQPWRVVPKATDFMQSDPNPGEASVKKSEVQVIYDDKAIYIGAYLYEEEPKKIKRELGLRDDDGVNASRFVFALDPFNSGQNAYMFAVTSAGVQIDWRIVVENADFAWDAVWDSEVKMQKDGWSVEMKIPYSAFRFPDRLNQTWGVNFQRVTRSIREISSWSPVDPKNPNFVGQFGTLTGISRVKPPTRLSFTPYLATYTQSFPNMDRGTNEFETKVSGGLDLKYGFSESATLDLSLIPDFGEVLSDDVELNLTPFEQYFDERRPFFTEGTDIFNRAGLFYSRRVGQKPIDFDNVQNQLLPNEVISKNPERARLINGTKFTNRTRRGTGIGFFNATTGNTYAQLEFGQGIFREILTSPLTNYNVMVIDQLLPNSSFVSFVNTNVMRNGAAYDANVTGTEVRFLDKSSTYAVSGNGAISQLFFGGTGNSTTGSSGFKYNIQLEKIKGNWVGGIGRNLESKNYNPNDLGFLFAPNELSHYGFIKYQTFEPKGALLRWNVQAQYENERLHHPDVFAKSELELSAFTTFKNYLSVFGEYEFDLQDRHDYFEARKDGQRFVIPAGSEGLIYMSSDYRKALAIDARYEFWSKTEEWKGWGLFVGPRIRVSDRFSINPSVSYNKTFGQQGFVQDSAGLGSSNPLFGIRDRDDIESIVDLSYLFNPKMSFSFRTRHNWSQVEYSTFHKLLDNGTLEETPFDHVPNEDINFNVFNVDLVYRWRWARGSELNLIYKNALLTQTDEVLDSYGDNLNLLFENDARHTFSVKILAYLDYLNLKRNRRR